jgi:hypothetical protein
LQVCQKVTTLAECNQVFISAVHLVMRITRAATASTVEEDNGGLPPLEQCIADFWRPTAALEDAESAPTAEHVPHALLRRMGPSPMGGKFPMVGLLASIYDSIRARTAE